MNNTHDLIFKENFSKKENGIDLLHVVLHPHLFNKLDLNSLILDNGSFTDKEDDIMTITMKFREEGIELGIEKGIEQGINRGRKKGS